MKWARCGKAYFNTALIISFYWSAGRLYVYWLGDSEPDSYKDPDRSEYLRLCMALGVRPVEEEDAADGEN